MKSIIKKHKAKQLLEDKTKVLLKVMFICLGIPSVRIGFINSK